MFNNEIKPVHIIINAVHEIIDKAKLFLLALLIPTLLMAFFITYQPYFCELIGLSAQGKHIGIKCLVTILLISSVVMALLSAIIGVSTHRLIILGYDSLPNKLGVYFSLREIKFMWWGFVCYIPSFIVGIIFSFFAPDIFKLIPEIQFENGIVYYEVLRGVITGIVVVFSLAFFGLILPGTAVENGYSLRKALFLAKGFRTPIFVSILISVVVIFVLSYIVNQVVVYFDIWKFDLIKLLIYSLNIGLGVFEIVVLSLIYKTLRESNAAYQYEYYKEYA